MSKPPSAGGALPECVYEFWKFFAQTEGTLPEVVAVEELATLNEGLRLLFENLRAANQWFQTGEGEGRGGAALALEALWRFTALFEKPRNECLHIPVQRLLDQITRSAPKRGGQPLTGIQEAIKGQAAGSVKRLMQYGMPQSQAYKQVAKVLARHGVRLQRHGQPANTVRYWCEDVAADVSRKSMAAIAFERLFDEVENNRYAGMPSDAERRDYALKALADYLRKVAPDGGR
jgi:hypothetical protein